MSNWNENGAEKLLADVLAENGQIPAGPVYQAYVSGTCVELGDRLEELLAVLRKDAALCDEDVAVWRGSRIAALLMHDGAVTYLEGSVWIAQPLPTHDH